MASDHDHDQDQQDQQDQLAELRRLQAEFGRIWQGLRKRADRPCAVCGTVMSGVVGNRRYCSEACRCAAYRRRHRDEYNARARARRQARRTPPSASASS